MRFSFVTLLTLLAASFSAHAATVPRLVAAYCCDNGYVADVYRGATKLRSLPLGHHPTDVAVTPDGKLLVIPQSTENSVLITDAQTGKLVRTVDVGGPTSRVVISPDGKTAYVPAYTSASVITAIDLATFSTRSSAPLVGASGIYNLAISPDGSRLYYLASILFQIDTASLNVVAQATAGSNYYTIAITPDGSEIYLNGAYAQRLLILAASDLHTVAEKVFPGIFIAFNHDGSRLYATDGSSLEEYDTATFQLLRTATNTLNANLTGLALSADGATIYAPIQYGAYLLEYDVTSWTEFAAPPVCTTLSTVAINPSENSAIAVNGASCSAAIVDLDSQKLQSSVELGLGKPYSMAVSSAGNQLQIYTASSKAEIGVANAAAQTTSVIPFSAPVFGIAASPDGSAIYASVNGAHPSIAIVDALSNTVTDTISLPAGASYPLIGTVLASPDGAHLAAMVELSPPNTYDSYSVVYLLDAHTHSILGALSLLGLSFRDADLSFTADSKHLYVPAYKALVEIDVTTFKISHIIPLAYSPKWVTVTPDGTAAITVSDNERPTTVSRIDLATDQVSARQIFSDYGIGKPLVTADSQAVYLPSQSQAIRILDPANLEILGSLPVTQTAALAFLP